MNIHGQSYINTAAFLGFDSLLIRVQSTLDESAKIVPPLSLSLNIIYNFGDKFDNW